MGGAAYSRVPPPPPPRPFTPMTPKERVAKLDADRGITRPDPLKERATQIAKDIKVKPPRDLKKIASTCRYVATGATVAYFIWEMVKWRLTNG